MKRLLITCGPTAVGKTALALELARRFDGELVNADSRQVYRGMDIGTGKDLSINSKFKVQNSKLGAEKYQIGYYLVSGVPIWLLDVVEPDYRFTVADYLKVAVPVIEDVWSRKKLPILVGGSGFYLKVLTEGVDTVGVKPNQILRKRLERLTVFKLQKKLKEVDPDRFNKMNNSDRLNPRRLIRAIEIATDSRKNLSKIRHLNLGKNNIFWIGLKMPLRRLDQAIAKRVKQRLNLGLLEEIESLLTRFSFSDCVLGETIAYQEWQDYFRSRRFEENREKLASKIIDRWQTNERQYARRQITWFKKNKQISWFRADSQNLFCEVVKKVGQWYIKSNG